MRDAGILRRPTRRRAPYEFSIVQENQLRPLRSHARLTLFRERGPLSNFAFRAGEKQQRVGLPHAKIAPASGFGLSHINDIVIGRLEAMEPMTGVSCRPDTPDEFRSAAQRQCLHELRRKAADVNFDALRNQRESASTSQGRRHT